MPERQAMPQGAKGCAVCGVRSRCFRCLKGGGPKVPTDLSGSRTLPRLHPRAPYPLRASLSTRTAMMINVPSFPNTQGHQDSPVVSLAFVGVPLPADPQAVQERATPLGACGLGRLPIVRRRVFVGFPPQLGLTRSPINGWHENPSSRRRVMGRASLSALALSVRVPPSPTSSHWQRGGVVMPCKAARATCCCPVWNKRYPWRAPSTVQPLNRRRAPRTVQPLKPKVPAACSENGAAAKTKSARGGPALCARQGQVILSSSSDPVDLGRSLSPHRHHRALWKRVPVLSACHSTRL